MTETAVLYDIVVYGIVSGLVTGFLWHILGFTTGLAKDAFKAR